MSLAGLGAALLLGLALHALLTRASLRARILAVNLLGAAATLLFGALAPAAAPVQPIAIAGLLVFAAATALALALLRR